MLRRIIAGGVALMLAGGTVACDGTAARMLEAPRPAEQVPAVEATLRAGLHATAVSVARSAEATPAAETPVQIEIGPTTGAPNPSMSNPVVPNPVVPIAVIPTPTARPARVATSRSVATPTVMAMTPLRTSVEPFGFTAYRLQSGWTFVQGFVENRGEAAAVNIQVVVSLIADGDVLAGSARAHVGPETLKPGERAPWLAQFQKPPEFERVRVESHAHPLTDALQATSTHDFRLEDVSVRQPADQISSPTIAGEVTSTGAHPVTDVQVVAAIYDEDGSLFQVVRGRVAQPELAPGERAPFEIRPLGRGLREIPRYEVFVEGRPSPRSEG